MSWTGIQAGTYQPGRGTITVNGKGLLVAVNEVNPIVPQYFQTLASLKLMGSNDGVAAGQAAWSTSGEGFVQVDGVTPTTSTWVDATTFICRFGGLSVSATLRFLDWYNENELSNMLGSQVQLHLGFAYRVEVLSYRASTTPGSTLVTLHKNGAAASWSDTRSPGAGVAQVIPVAPFLTVAAADYLSFGFDKTNSGGDADGYVVLRKLL